MTQHYVSGVPCDPLEPHLPSPNRVLVGGPCAALIPHAPAGLSCGPILLWDLSPLAARALFPAGTEVLFRRVPFASTRRTELEKKNTPSPLCNSETGRQAFFVRFCELTRKGAPPKKDFSLGGV
ncbi:MAG: hypothetical protein JSS30_01375 [Verrucomicrobia bacterium]|nr:hypothetical protein [Verrucomicrobiota bacterium]